MKDKITELNSDGEESSVENLKNRKEELESKIKQEEEYGVYLTHKLQALEQNLSQAKQQYNKQQKLKSNSKRRLDKLNKSRSWKISKPIRKAGKVFKKTTPQKSSDPKKASTATVEERVHSIEMHRESRNLDRKLWGGFSEYALEGLLNMRNSSEQPLLEQMRASKSLSRWYFDKGEYQKAHDELEHINQIKPINRPSPERTITEVKVLGKLARREEAKKKVWETIEDRGLLPNLLMSMSYLADNEAERLTWYNLLYDKYGYQQISKINENKPLDLENIKSPMISVAEELEKYKVSVIIPAYSAEDLIHVALDSLLNQTIQNIEIIVVDDCSPDKTADVVEEYTKRDSRVKLIRKEVNQGAYAARNTGLKYVTGDFITIHDSDDWSHSQKLEVQLQELVYNKKAVGSLTYLVRTAKNIELFNAGSLLNSKFIMMNSSSLLIRKHVVDELGGWDSVRVAGDSEFLWRVEKIYGEESVVRLEPDVPFSISLSAESSLTGKKTTHVKTIWFGLRRSYREAFEWWHSKAESPEDLYMDPDKVNRHFPCPVPNRLIKPETRDYDYTIVADFSEAQEMDATTAFLKHMGEKDSRVAVFHWPNYKGDPNARVADHIYALIDQYDIDILVPNEEVQTDKMVFFTPHILDYAIDSVPEVTYNRTMIVSDEEMAAEDKSKKEENLKQAMNLTGVEWYTNQTMQVK